MIHCEFYSRMNIVHFINEQMEVSIEPVKIIKMSSRKRLRNRMGLIPSPNLDVNSSILASIFLAMKMLA